MRSSDLHPSCLAVWHFVAGRYRATVTATIEQHIITCATCAPVCDGFGGGAPGHLDEGRLLRYLTGAVGEDELANVEEHLLICDICREHADTLDLLTDGPDLEQLAELLGAPIVKALLRQSAIRDDSPYTTGGIGLLGTEPSEEAMASCDTLLMVGTSFPGP